MSVAGMAYQRNGGKMTAGINSNGVAIVIVATALLSTAMAT